MFDPVALGMAWFAGFMTSYGVLVLAMATFFSIGVSAFIYAVLP